MAVSLQAFESLSWLGSSPFLFWWEGLNSSGDCLMHMSPFLLIPGCRSQQFGDLIPVFWSLLCSRVSQCSSGWLELLSRPGWLQIQRSACLCLLSTGIKGAWQQASVVFLLLDCDTQWCTVPIICLSGWDTSLGSIPSRGVDVLRTYWTAFHRGCTVSQFSREWSERAM